MSRISLEPAPRRIDAPRWAIVVFGIWLITVTVAGLIELRTGEDVPLCLFRGVTGAPCPTCGSTRAGLALFGGDVVGAVRFNPFMVTAGVVLVAWLGLRLGLGRRVRLTPRLQWTLGAVTLALFAANWIYLIQAGI